MEVITAYGRLQRILYQISHTFSLSHMYEGTGGKKKTQEKWNQMMFISAQNFLKSMRRGFKSKLIENDYEKK